MAVRLHRVHEWKGEKSESQQTPPAHTTLARPGPAKGSQLGVRPSALMLQKHAVHYLDDCLDGSITGRQ